MAVIEDEACDVAIMGAGAAGALFAARLSAAGRRVVVLDAGKPWELTDLVSSQIWARRLKWGGAPVLPGGTHPFGHNMSTGAGFGGAAIHHYAGWPRLHEADFTMRSDHGRGNDWPFGYATLRPHYDRVQAEMGISGDGEAEVWRPPGDPYPMGPLMSFKQAEVLKRGFDKLGIRVSAAPMAVNSEEFDGRPACVYDGWCDAGCPIGALANPLVKHLPAAKKAGAILRSDAAVTRIEQDPKGRAIGLRWVDRSGGEHIQRARTIVLAGAAVQNARLLLASDIGNSSGLVGHWFNGHNIANANGLFAEETECHMGLSSGTLMSQDGYGKTRDGPFGSYTWSLAPAVKASDLLGIAMTRPELFGAPLDAFIRRAAKHFGQLVAICESVPVEASRIELAPARDRFGMPLARIVNSPDPETLRLWDHVSAEGLRIVKAAGATEAWSLGQRTFAHVSGGTIMGRDPATSVTDSLGRLHDAANVVAAGGGLFPTIGAVSPTFTVLALADRTAADMTANWGSYAA